MLLQWMLDWIHRGRLGVFNHSCCAFLVTLSTVLFLSVSSNAATPKEIKSSIDLAEDALEAGKAINAVPHLKEAIRGLEESIPASRIPVSLRLLARRCSAIRGKLELDGIDVSEIIVPSTTGSPSRVSMPTTDQSKSSSAGKMNSSEISFSKQIAPILVRSCGSCHIGGKKGEFYMPTFAALAQSGVVQPGVGQASRMVEVIASGDMPRGNRKVGADELKMLIEWIDKGALYDGGNPTLPLTALAGQIPANDAKNPKKTEIEVAELKPGETSFAIDIAPVLIESCLACHGGFETESGMSMATFSRLLRGGGSGVAIVPGDAANSLFVKKIRGVDIDGQRMPLGKDPLSNDVINSIVKWINEGARLDIAGAGGDIRTIAANGRSKSLSNEELRIVRQDAASNYWRRFLPDESPHRMNGSNVCIIGNLAESRIEALTALADSAWNDVEKYLGTTKDQSNHGKLLKGGVVVYGFNKAYDFSEFWLVANGSDRPRGLTASAGVQGDVVYAALVAPDSLLSENDPSKSDVAFLIIEQLASVIFLVNGAPEWFAKGAGQSVAMDLVSRASIAQDNRSGLPEALRKVSSCSDFLNGRVDVQSSAIVASVFLD
ncbi:MAG: c-type cytochrome domain-containing protein, partial [Pirellulales bacterium]